MSRRPDPHRALCRSLMARLGAAPQALRHSASQPWCSATFTGARHQLAVALDDGGMLQQARALVAQGEEAEFSLPGHIVADMAARLETQTAPDGPTLLRIEALTVEAI